MSTHEWKLIGRGFAGWHAQAGKAHNSASASGGDINPYTYWTGEKCAGYAQEAVEGCPVYDASACEEDEGTRNAFISLIVRGPLVDVDLPDLGPHAYATAKSFDYVPAAEIIRRVRQIRGVRIGVIHNGAVQWDAPAERLRDDFAGAVQLSIY
jgi:hypothetical protein